VLLVALPAVARQARPGTTLWPLRQAGQQVRLTLASDPVERAGLRLDTAEQLLDAAAGAREGRRDDLADAAEDEIDAAVDQLEDVAGPRAAAQLARAELLLVAVEALEDRDGDRHGGAGGSDDDRSGRRGGSDHDRSGRGGGDGSGSGSSGSGSGASGSGSSGSGSGSGSGSSRSGGSGGGSPGDD
jgi:hypothetical protein